MVSNIRSRSAVTPREGQQAAIGDHGWIYCIVGLRVGLDLPQRVVDRSTRQGGTCRRGFARISSGRRVLVCGSGSIEYQDRQSFLTSDSEENRCNSGSSIIDDE